MQINLAEVLPLAMMGLAGVYVIHVLALRRRVKRLEAAVHHLVCFGPVLAAAKLVDRTGDPAFFVSSERVL